MRAQSSHKNPAITRGNCVDNKSMYVASRAAEQKLVYLPVGGLCNSFCTTRVEQPIMYVGVGLEFQPRDTRDRTIEGGGADDTKVNHVVS